jgi:hypothetical protein
MSSGAANALRIAGGGGPSTGGATVSVVPAVAFAPVESSTVAETWNVPASVGSQLHSSPVGGAHPEGRPVTETTGVPGAPPVTASRNSTVPPKVIVGGNVPNP